MKYAEEIPTSQKLMNAGSARDGLLRYMGGSLARLAEPDLGVQALNYHVKSAPQFVRLQFPDRRWTQRPVTDSGSKSIPRPWVEGTLWRTQASASAWSRTVLIMYSACQSFPARCTFGRGAHKATQIR